MALLVPLVVLLFALFAHVLNDFGPLDIYAPPQPSTENSRYFSASYYEARALFRAQAAAAKATLVTRPLEGLEPLDGFAGSAIQSALLERVAAAAGDGSEQEADPTRPTVILVHALNAYGFAQLRRFNEHNVDLNRNWLTPKNFTAFVAADPNAYGYMDVFDLLNPSTLSGLRQSFWAKAAYYLATAGFAAVKRATVSGNYRFPQSIFYGGGELQPSLRILRDFLVKRVELDGVRAFAFIDVHTGLGAPGVDTLMASTGSDIERLTEVFGELERTTNKIVPVRGGAGNDVSQGYDGSFGFIIDGVAALLPPSSRKNNVLVVQEFGTVAGPFVLKAVVEENFVFHAAPGERLAYAEKLRDVFYLHKSAQWKRDVLARGLAVFDQVYAHIGTCE
ncbi:hypothetical protein PybrP1_012522 [[Pythium] brassicae (nom. inval.)]|nr:hypothetical protein PybrP1_012522 [[Pythium] brassicae (nom. inval.)]